MIQDKKGNARYSGELCENNRCYRSDIRDILCWRLWAPAAIYKHLLLCLLLPDARDYQSEQPTPS